MLFLLRSIKAWFSLCIFRSKWKKKNRHNDTYANTIFPIEKVSVGKHTYGVLNINSYRNPNEELRIGDFCSIASEVLFVLSGEHNIKGVSTYPFGEKIFGEKKYVAKSKGPIIIEDDVWIGVRCTILSGVTIGQGSVIGANSIVYKDVPPYSIYIGNKIVKSRFEKSISDKLTMIDFKRFNDKDIHEYHKVLDLEVSAENIDMIMSLFPLKERVS